MLKDDEVMEEAIEQIENHDFGDDAENESAFTGWSAVLPSPRPPFSDVADSFACLEAMSAEFFIQDVSFCLRKSKIA